MDEREEFKQELTNELELVKYRIKMLDIMEEKLLNMEEIAERIRKEKLSLDEVNILNSKLNDLALQVKAIDGESRRLEDGKILE
ncbi:hypothetical protein [Clostridium beijerinckii]|uniref:hypothetical protein n=1 Tax=Clostridium beijerinckii TaxID=1520 RepID=UPI0002EC20FA|nr:hypothetical protein [Clostridium beijerinckii]